jgi:hypothetical protein
MNANAWLSALFAVFVTGLAANSLLAAPPVPPPESRPKLDVPYVPTPEAVLDRMLEFAAPGKDDYLIDLGCGDGRIPVAAAQRFGTRGLGVDIDPLRIREANENAQKAKVTDKVTFRQANLFDTKIADATILTLYLLPAINLELRPRILNDLKPGTRVVSHDFDMGDWTPDREARIGDSKTVFLWIVPAKAAGSWTVNDGGKQFTLNLKQKFQQIAGEATIDGQTVPLRNARLEGRQISFEVPEQNGQSKRYEGQVNDNTIQGETWQAKPVT